MPAPDFALPEIPMTYRPAKRFVAQGEMGVLRPSRRACQGPGRLIHRPRASRPVRSTASRRTAERAPAPMRSGSPRFARDDDPQLGSCAVHKSALRPLKSLIRITLCADPRGGARASAPPPGSRYPSNRLLFGKPFGGSRPASARLPIHSLSSGLATVNVRPAESRQVRPSRRANTLASEMPPSL